METTDKEACNILVDVMVSHGVKYAVVSPGSRNAPILIALARRHNIKKYVVVDERSAAFVALGISQRLNQPVALVCTSGTALLNYAPAIAEAYYQKIPLIVISADRPMEWIDQDDSQTICQPEVLSRIVKKSYNIPSRCSDSTAKWYVERIANDALIEAATGRKSPVHINVELDEPLSGFKEYNQNARTISVIQPTYEISDSNLNDLVKEASGKNILIIAGFQKPDTDLQQSLDTLSNLPNVVVATETVSNIVINKSINAIDRTLLAMPKSNEAEFVPELLITFGGAIISRMIKAFLRKYKVKRHWYVGLSNTTIDCMQSLTTRIETEPDIFFRRFAAKMQNQFVESDFAKKWHDIYLYGKRFHSEYIKKSEWSDLKALSLIMPSLTDCILQLSNGTSIRYAQLFGDSIAVDNYCNRGVSGIDGSTSTALGTSLVADKPVLLITGDMSFSYDISGLASQYNSSGFKIIVMNNGGGGIFRFIKSTSELPELEQYFEVKRQIPIAKYADAFGFEYFLADNEDVLMSILPKFISFDKRAAILEIRTDGETSGRILKNYFKR